MHIIGKHLANQMPQLSLLTYILYLQLEDGDIICFQKASSMDSEENARYPDVPSYLEYVHNRQVLLLFGFTECKFV